MATAINTDIPKKIKRKAIKNEREADNMHLSHAFLYNDVLIYKMYFVFIKSVVLWSAFIGIA